jgi:hypothetical protein
MFSSRMNKLVYIYVKNECEIVFKLLIKRLAVAMMNKTVVITIQ